MFQKEPQFTSMRVETMNYILTILLLIGGLPSLMAYRCLTYPVGYLENGCAIRNLTVRDSYSNLLTEDRLCDTTINLPSHALNRPYEINFTDVVGQQYWRSTFLLIVLDNTSKQLLWMVANISVPVYDRRLTPLSGFHNRPYTLKPYEKPTFNATHRQHQIEFLVLQQDLNFPQYAHFIQQSNYTFNLLHWLDEQTSGGARLCGPVAGAMVRIYDNSYYPPVYRNTYPPYPGNQNGGTLYPMSPPLSPPLHSSHPTSGNKNTAFCINSNISLLGAVVGVAIYCCCHQRLYQ